MPELSMYGVSETEFMGVSTRQITTGAKGKSLKMESGKSLPRQDFIRGTPSRPGGFDPPGIGGTLSATPRVNSQNLPNMMDGPATIGPSARISDWEAVLANKGANFVERGEAWRSIRDSGLFEGRGNFSAYCSARWGIKKSRAYQLIAAEGVVEDLRPFSTLVDNLLPERERHARLLVGLPSGQALEVWKAVAQNAKAEGKQITSSLIKQVLERLFPESAAKRPSRGASWAVFDKAWRLIQREKLVTGADLTGVLPGALKTIAEMNKFLQEILNNNQPDVRQTPHTCKQPTSSAGFAP